MSSRVVRIVIYILTNILYHHVKDIWKHLGLNTHAHTSRNFFHCCIMHTLLLPLTYHVIPVHEHGYWFMTTKINLHKL